MSTPFSAVETLDREFLTLRARLIDVAAMLDRIDRAPDAVADDPRIKNLQRAIAILATPDANRVEQIQRTMSDEGA